MTTTTIDSPGAPPRAPQPPSADRPSGLSPLVGRLSLALTLLAVAALYTWNLSASGYANSFYSAAAQAGAQSWTAFFYGSLDAGNSITVDKTPASLWLMALSVRIFGLSSWSILLPQALLGVASAWILYGTVRRSLARGGSARRAHWAGIVAALAFALTPAATLMFRFNNPDALMVFCYVAAAALTLRAAETASRGRLALAGALIGLGFLAKMLQAFVILPSLVLAYAIAAPASWRKKVVDLLTAFGAMVLAFGWWVAIVELVPESWRPYIGGSQTNSILELTFGYNGLGRLNGNETGSVGGGQWGQTGILRMFVTVSGQMASWLIPAALLLVVAGLVLLGRRAWATSLRAGAETHATRTAGALALFGSWLAINTLVFSFMAGIYHDYYTVALAPAIGAGLALGGAVAWTHRHTWLGRGALALAALATAAWGMALASVAGGVYLAVSVGAAVVLAGFAAVVAFGRALARPLQAAALGGAVVAALAGPAAYSLNTAATPHTGSIVTAGPVRTGLFGGNGGPGGGGPGGGQDGGRPGGGQRGQNQPGTTQGGGTQPGGTQGGAQGQPGGSTQGQGGGTAQGQGRGRGGGGAGGLLNGASVSSELLGLLTTDAGEFTWVAATTGAQNAASYQLASGYPVMAIGGFNGSDPSPTLEQFQAWVAEGKVHYFIGGGNFRGQNGGSGAASEIASWVQRNYTATTVGGVAVYDLTAAK